MTQARSYADVAGTSGDRDPTPAESASGRGIRQTGPALALQDARLSAVEETLAGVVRDLAALRREVAQLRAAQSSQPPARAPAPAPGRASASSTAPGRATASSTAVGDDCFYSGNQNMEGCLQLADRMIQMKSKGAKPKYRSVCPVCRDFAVAEEGFARDYVEE